MKSRPEDINESHLTRALEAWNVHATELTYAPVGFGDHHWTATGANGQRWFVTVADLPLKGHPDPQAALRSLRAAMDTAAALHHLDFVVAPLKTPKGETVRPLDARFALSVFPYMRGTPGDYDRPQTPAERAAVIDLLAELHREPPPAMAPVLDTELALRGVLDKALAGTLPWAGGPFAAHARTLITDHAPALRRRLAEFDQLSATLAQSGVPPVLTHGEPHPGNLLRQDDRLLLIDWDTTGLALPERDLWSVAETPEDLARYARAAGRAPDPAALALYRTRWDLDEVAIYTDWFRSPHTRSSDTKEAWDGLLESVANLVTSPQNHAPPT
ncbi:phosphotransferase [Actinomadura terrae]|uniref:phosphotransferase n=1 Tax=Actinomadura terrae TaxID=604353 RepID=UPI001FA6B4EF|nr:phosphotransferase [Actinomadura terrae]